MNGEDITQFNIRSFYDHSRRRRTTLAKYIFLLQINKDRERSKHLIKKMGGKKKSNQQSRECIEHLIEKEKSPWVTSFLFALLEE